MICSDFCPLVKDCPSCEYQGGATVSVTYGARSETIEEPRNEAAPMSASNTPEGLTTRLSRSRNG